jgi:hypothetical protein
MRGRGAALTLLSTAILLAAAAPAGAVLMGTRSHSLTSYTVRLVGNGSCSAVVIARRLVATARHCAYGMTVLAAHHYYRVAEVSRSGVLDDGRQVYASGDSGGPVLRGGVLVGVITRAAHPSPRRACGDLTRWAPISVSGNVEELGAGAEKTLLPKARSAQHVSGHRTRQTPVKQAAATGWFGNWFAVK